MGLEFLAGLGLAAAGTGLSVAGAQQSQSAMNDKAKAELINQQGYSQRSKAAFDNSVTQATPDVAKKNIDTGAASSLANYINLQQQPTGSQGSSYTDPVTQAKTSATIGQSNQARSALQGYSTWAMDDYLKNLAVKQQQSIIGQEAGLSAGVLPLELQQASQAGAGLQAGGSALSSLGSLAGLYGVYGGLNKTPKNLPSYDPAIA